MLKMNFKIGEKISFLLEKGGGTIIKIEGPNRIIVLDDSGFDRPFFINEIVKIHSIDYKLDNFNLGLNTVIVQPPSSEVRKSLFLNFTQSLFELPAQLYESKRLYWQSYLAIFL